MVTACAILDDPITMTQDGKNSTRRSRPSAARLSGKSVDRHSRLRFESLEDRHLLSVSSDWVNPSDPPNQDSSPVVNPYVVVVTGNGNTDAASLDLYGGPGDPNLPGFNNVGKSSTTNASVVYLGGGWVLTANHVSISNPGGVTFAGITYQVDTNSIHQLHNYQDNSLADLKVFRIYGDPQLPAILPSYIPTEPATGQIEGVPQSGHVFMIGNGLSLGEQQRYWEVDLNQTPWVWTEISEPVDPDPTEPPSLASGWDISGQRTIRWGENTIDYPEQFLASVWGFVTQFDDDGYTVNPYSDPLAHEAQAVSGDSGGAFFSYVDNKWMLSGITITVSNNFSGQPANTVVFGFQTLAADLSYYRDEILAVTGVVGRQVFYNQSTFDGYNAAVNAADDTAIATDKSAYLPGAGLAGPVNVTSYSRGINGIMIDFVAPHGVLTQNDFTLKVGNNSSPSTWTAAPTPVAVAVRAGAGVNGSDRVEIVWANGAIRNTWLEVTVEGNDAIGGLNTNTGLRYSDVFFFGNIIGDSFEATPATFFQTTSTDATQAFANIGNASITSPYDYNRTGSVTSTDAALVFANIGTVARINIGSAGPFAPEGGDAVDADDLGSAVASALVRTNTPGDPEPLSLHVTQSGLRITDEERRSRERAFEYLVLVEEGKIQQAKDGDLDQDASDFWLDVEALELRALADWKG